MKAPIWMLTLSLALGIAAAQTTPTPDQKTPQADSQMKTQSGTKTASSSATPSEMKTTTFKGILVDMACASHGSASAEATPPASDQSNTANRSTSDSGANCPVSANSSELGMKLDGGKTVHFDLVGNQRAQDAIKSDKRWSKDLSANKPIHATVSGVLNGDKLIVSSIH
jgi:hypothetical protein